MIVVLKETCCNKVSIQITQRDDFIQIRSYLRFINVPHLTPMRVALLGSGSGYNFGQGFLELVTVYKEATVL